MMVVVVVVFFLIIIISSKEDRRYFLLFITFIYYLLISNAITVLSSVAFQFISNKRTDHFFSSLYVSSFSPFYFIVDDHRQSFTPLPITSLCYQ